MFKREMRWMLVMMLLPLIAGLLAGPFVPMLIRHAGPNGSVGSALADILRGHPERARPGSR